MNTQEYISSGIVESYVLGLLSEEERKEFEQVCSQHPEVQEARTAFELSLEKQAMENAIAPPAQLRNKIFSAISSDTAAPADKTVQPRETPVKKMTNWWKYAAAASVLLLAGSIYWNIDLSKKNKVLEGNYNNTVAELGDLKKDLSILQQNPGVKMAAMNGQPVSPASFTTVYWDTTSQDVYLMINNLPKPASDQQYQLWAFLNGQPVDMGLIEITEKPLQLYRLKKAQQAEAFAITLEKRNRGDISKPGGQVYVLGKL
ncbi:MAG: anti-sigma factor [Chitinophagaceae bacterium]|nr:anti-sigma factor [Chitinophagaceae bacterium]